MNPRSEPPSRSIRERLRALLLADAHRDGDDFQLNDVAPNPARADFASRRQFVLHPENGTPQFLVAGERLGDLYERSAGFAAACPSVTCKPLWWRREPTLEVIATEFCEGVSLEEALADQRLTIEEAQVHVRATLAALDATTNASSLKSFKNELDGLLKQVATAPIWTSTDRLWLEEYVFPFVRIWRPNEKPTTRWTNGDFVARNLLITRQGPRLVDCEFAQRTHFWREDYWRWRTYSQLPTAASSLLPDVPPFNPVEQVVFLLRQIVLEALANGASGALASAPQLVRQIIDLIRAATPDRQAGIFLTAVHSGGASTLSANRLVTVQLFWDTGRGFIEADSARELIGLDAPHTITFRVPVSDRELSLRLDPCDQTAFVQIHQIKVEGTSAAAPFFVFDASTSWNGVAALRQCARLHAGDAYLLLSGGEDPSLMFEPIAVGTQEVRIEVSITVSHNPQPLLGLLSAARPVERPEEVARPLADLHTALDSLRDQMQAHHEELAQRHAEAAARWLDEISGWLMERDRYWAKVESETDQVRHQQHESSRVVTDLTNQLARRDASLAAAEALIVELRAEQDRAARFAADALAERNRQLALAEGEAEYLRRHQEDSSRTVIELTDRLARREASLATAERLLVELRAEQDHGAQAVTRWREEAARLVARFEEQATAFELERDAARREHAALLLVIDEQRRLYEQQMVVLQTDVAERDNRIANLASELAGKGQALAQAKADASRHSAHIATLETELADHRTRWSTKLYAWLRPPSVPRQ